MLGILALVLGLSACRASATAPRKLPGGTYTNTRFHFTVDYPAGWQVNVQPQSSTFAPLSLSITRSGELKSNGSLVSTFGVTIFNAADPTLAAFIAKMKTDKTLHATTIAGLQGYQAAPVARQLPGSQSTVTHTEYYVVHDTYEYQLSTDAVQGDNADDALAGMLKSFSITP
jgi:hypothetical protein